VRVRTFRLSRMANQHVPHWLAIFVDFLTAHPSTNRSPQSTPILPTRSPYAPDNVSPDSLLFELLSILFRYIDRYVLFPSASDHLGSRLTHLSLQHAKRDRISRFRSLGTSFLSLFLPLCSYLLPFIHVGRRAFDDRDAVERWRSATHTTGSRFVVFALQYSVLRPPLSRFTIQIYFLSTQVGLENVCFSPLFDCNHAQSSTSTTELQTREGRPHAGPLLASRTLPPPHPRSQFYPLLRPFEWSPPSYRRDGDDHRRSIHIQEDDQPPPSILPSPLTTSSEDSYDQR